MSKDETGDPDPRAQEQRIAELESENKKLKGQLQGLISRQQKLIKIMAGEAVLDDETPYYLRDVREERDEPITEQLDGLETLAQSAYAVANTLDKQGAEKTKKDVAEEIARNQAVKRAYNLKSDKAEAADVTAPEVGRMAQPQLDLAPKTVRDGMEDVAERWAALTFREGDGRGRGQPNKLACEWDKVSPALAKTVADGVESLDTDEVMNFVHNRGDD